MRKLNSRILERIETLKKGVKIDGLPVKIIGTDKALAQLLDVHQQTIAAWRNAGILPHKMVGQNAVYKLKDVIQALEEHSQRDLTYAEALEAVTRELDKIELYERIKALEARVDALVKQMEQ